MDMAVEFEIIGLVALSVSTVGIIAFVQLMKFKKNVKVAFENIYAAIQPKQIRERVITDIPLNNIPLEKKQTTSVITPLMQTTEEVVETTQETEEPMQLDRDIVMQIFKENQEYSKRMDQNLEVLRKQLRV